MKHIEQIIQLANMEDADAVLQVRQIEIGTTDNPCEGWEAFIESAPGIPLGFSEINGFKFDELRFRVVGDSLPRAVELLDGRCELALQQLELAS